MSAMTTNNLLLIIMIICKLAAIFIQCDNLSFLQLKNVDFNFVELLIGSTNGLRIVLIIVLEERVNIFPRLEMRIVVLKMSIASEV